MNKLKYFFSVAFLALLPVLVFAADDKLDKPLGDVTSIRGLAEVLFKLGIALCVLTAAIYIAIGSYHYFAQAGNASSAEKGKEIIQRAITGLVLALISWIILNTIHPQFAEKLKDPSFNQK